MDLNEAIYSRRAVRAFTADPVDERTIRTLINAAIQAPSAVNAELWIFSIVRDPARLAEISRKAKAQILRTMAKQAPSGHFAEMMNDPNFDILYHAPALIVIAGPKSDSWTEIDCSLAAENLMLAARAAGLGSCWIGSAQDWLSTPEGKTAINLHEDEMPIAPIIIGYPKSEPKPVPRKEANIRWVDAAA